jgi:hypothetical protein
MGRDRKEMLTGLPATSHDMSLLKHIMATVEQSAFAID